MRTRAPHLESFVIAKTNKLNYSFYPPGEVAGPREAEEGDGGEVVDKHLPEVFSLHVEKLHDGQRPVESQLKEFQV